MKLKKRKRALTLLEVGIAIFLTGILLSFLWNLYHRWNCTLIQLQEEKHILLQKILLQEKFSKVFSHLCPQEIEEKKNSVFYSASLIEDAPEGLIFSYDGGIDPDPNFCGTLLGSVYLSPYKELCFISWSKNGSARRDILMDKVSSCSFQFFDAKKKKWKNAWSKKKERLPAMVKISILPKGAEEPLYYSFSIVDSIDPIFYEEMKKKS